MNLSTDVVIQILSLIGASVVLLSFFFLQSGRYASDSKEYLSLGLAGSLILTGAAILMMNIGFILLNIAYIIIGVWKWFTTYGNGNGGRK